MKATSLVSAGLLAALVLASCAGSPEPSAAAAPQAESGAIAVENAFYYRHVDGHGGEKDVIAFVPFEYELLKKVKYQVVYIACTCRGPEVNYYSVAYVELSKEDGSVLFISYDNDSSGHYTGGMYGDSYVTYEGVEAKDLFDGFIKDSIVGKSQADINAYEAMHGEVDAFTGATVTPNNAMRMLQGLFKYHNTRYMKP